MHQRARSHISKRDQTLASTLSILDLNHQVSPSPPRQEEAQVGMIAMEQVCCNLIGVRKNYRVADHHSTIGQVLEHRSNLTKLKKLRNITKSWRTGTQRHMSPVIQDKRRRRTSGRKVRNRLPSFMPVSTDNVSVA